MWSKKEMLHKYNFTSYKCFVCNTKFRYYKFLVSHSKTVTCSQCSKIFKCAAQFKKHLHYFCSKRNRVKITYKEGGKFFNNLCSKCGRHFTAKSKKRLLMQMQIHVCEKSPCGSKKDSYHLCSVCGKSFPFAFYLYKHQLEHAKEKRGKYGEKSHDCKSTYGHMNQERTSCFLCSDCGEKFHSLQEFSKHNAQVHCYDKRNIKLVDMKDISQKDEHHLNNQQSIKMKGASMCEMDDQPEKDGQNVEIQQCHNMRETCPLEIENLYGNNELQQCLNARETTNSIINKIATCNQPESNQRQNHTNHVLDTPKVQRIKAATKQSSQVIDTSKVKSVKAATKQCSQALSIPASAVAHNSENLYANVKELMQSTQKESEVHICGVCGAKFHTMQHLSVHLYRTFTTPVLCSECQIELVSCGDLLWHEQKVTHSVSLKVIKCVKCKRKVSFFGTKVLKQCSICDIKNMCSECEEYFASKDDLELHKTLRSFDSTYNCRKCGLIIHSVCDLVFHKKMCQVKRFQCVNCKKNKSATSDGTKLPKLCIFCNKIMKIQNICGQFQKSFGNNEGSHKRLHSFDSTYRCLNCGLIVHSLCGLGGHRKICSIEEFECMKCKTCISASFRGRKLPKQCFNCNNKQCVCNECDEYFDSNENLEVHKRLQSFDSTFICFKCGLIIHSLCGLDFHKKMCPMKKFECMKCRTSTSATHGRKFPKQYFKCYKQIKCEQCDKYFDRDKDLEYHKSSQSLDSTYICLKCGLIIHSVCDVVFHKKMCLNSVIVKCFEIEYKINDMT